MTTRHAPAGSIDLAREYAAGGVPVATATAITGDLAGRRVVVTGSDVSGSFGTEQLDQKVATATREQLAAEMSLVRTVSAGPSMLDVFIEVYPPRPRLVILGAVHIAQALIELSRPFGFETIVIDARATLANRERFPDVDTLIVAWPDEGLAEVEVATRDAIVVLTHDPKFDEPALVSALQTEAGYIGAVGSRKTSIERRERLEAHGVTDAEMGRIHGPIGLDIGGKSPAEMALSILAEIIAVRYGKSGSPLKDARTRVRGDGD